jgi:hypothetical protein
MREYGVEVCSEECGETRIGLISVMYGLHWWHEEIDTVIVRGGERFCPSCGTRVGIDERGPWREAMVPRAALEWLAGISEGCAQVSPCPANKPLSDANKEALCRECLVQAALKAAEEASDGD